VGPSAACLAVSSAGEAPTGAVQPPSEGAVRENGALFFDAMRTAAVRYLAFNPVRARRAAKGNALARVAPPLERIARFDDLLEVTFEKKSVIGGIWVRPSFWKRPKRFWDEPSSRSDPAPAQSRKRSSKIGKWRRNSQLIGAADKQQFSFFIGS